MDIHTLSLFSGVGGLDLGVSLALNSLGHTARPVCYVERELFAASVLAARMEDGSLHPAPVWSDVTTFDGRELAGRVDLVVGGFPCQDISNAGRRAGIIPGNRSGLWFEFHRIICEVRPRYVFIENVSALLGRGLDVVLGTLAESGFDAEWTTLRASDTGAPHQRERVFILAYAGGERQRPDGDVRSESDSERTSERPFNIGSSLAHASSHEPERRGIGGELAGAGTDAQGEARQRQWGGHTAGDSGTDVAYARESGRRSTTGTDTTGWAGVGEQGGAGSGESGGDAVRRPQFISGNVGDTQRAGLEIGRAQRGDVGEERPAAERSSLPLYPPGPADAAGCGRPDAPGGVVGYPAGQRFISGSNVHEQPRDEARTAGEQLGRGVGQADPQEPGLEERGRRRGDGAGQPGPERHSLPLYPPGPADGVGWRAVLERWPDLAPATVSPVRGVADGPAPGLDQAGSAYRAQQLRALGNGVVPLQAAVAFLILAERIGGL